MKYKNILITGGCGFIGSNFINHMLDKYEDIKIFNIDKMSYASNENNILKKDIYSKYTLIKEDINEIENLNIDKNIDLVVNFAAESHVDNSISSPSNFIYSNINGTFKLLEFVKSRKIRLHHISTDEVFGSIKFGSFNENSPYYPNNVYSASKAASDHLVRAYIHTYGIDATISNCTNNYGPRQHFEKFIPTCIKKILNNEKIPIYGTGDNERDWIFVKDHCKAIDIILSDGLTGQTYCIGGNYNISNIELAKKIIKIINGNDYYNNLVDFVKDRSGHDFRYSVDISKIRNTLGWCPETNFEEGLNETIEWYKIL